MNYEIGGNMKFTFKVLGGSPLINKRFGEVNKKFGIKICYYYNPTLKIEARKIPKENDTINENMYITVVGPPEALKKATNF